jgi:hypothetical protein
LLFGAALGSAKAEHEMRLRERQIVPTGITGARWTYFGVSPAPFGHCICPSAKFDVDGFDRIAVTDAVNHRIKLLDSAGNLLMAIGRYGNRDSRGPTSDLPIPPIPLHRPTAVASARDLIHVFDEPSNRVMRIRLTYRAHSSAPVPP